MVAEGTPRAKNAKKKVATRVENAGDIVPSIFFLFLFYFIFDTRRYKKIAHHAHFFFSSSGMPECGYQILSPRSYRLTITIILQGHPGSSGAL